MILRPLPLPGAFLIEPERIEDSRGFFARTWCASELERHGLEARISQCSISHNARRGTLRGIHFQEAPHDEAKVVSCPRGAIFDVLVDLRPGSPTRYQWCSVELRGGSYRAVFAPRGVAHGFQTLEDDSDVEYLISEPYEAGAARGIRYDDPKVGVAWPIPDPILSPRDRQHPLL